MTSETREFAAYVAGVACGVEMVVNAMKSPPAHKMMPSGKLTDTRGKWDKVRSYPVGRSYLLDIALSRQATPEAPTHD